MPKLHALGSQGWHDRLSWLASSTGGDWVLASSSIVQWSLSSEWKFGVYCLLKWLGNH